MKITIIVPVLNEAENIRPFLAHTRSRAPDAQLIVVDGGSTDGTPDRARGLCDVLTASPRGRPFQMNSGARMATGDILWFLHADCEIPRSGCASIIGAMSDSNTVGGCFRVRILHEEWVFRVHDELAHHIGRILQVRCGDHGIFIRRQAFQEIGGYRDVPIMEDVELFRAMRRHGRIAWLKERLTLSSRRHLQVGVYRYTFVCAVIIALYCVRLSHRSLSVLYSWLVPGRANDGGLPVENTLFGEFRAEYDAVDAGQKA